MLADTSKGHVNDETDNDTFNEGLVWSSSCSLHQSYYTDDVELSWSKLIVTSLLSFLLFNVNNCEDDDANNLGLLQSKVVVTLLVLVLSICLYDGNLYVNDENNGNNNDNTIVNDITSKSGDDGAANYDNIIHDKSNSSFLMDPYLNFLSWRWWLISIQKSYNLK